MKIASMILVLLLCATELVAQCQYCQYHSQTNTYTCPSTCTYAAGCTGCCVIHIVAGQEYCYVGGCCTYQPPPNTGYICMDPTGDDCGDNPCPGYTLPTEALFSESSQRVVLSKVIWITDKNFPVVIGRVSNSFQKAIAAFQDIVVRTPGYSMKEYDWRSFQMTVRPHFPVKITVSHPGGDNWVIYLDKPDTEAEGPQAPSMLEIVGNQWRLISHQVEHATDKSNDKYVIASGTVQ